MRGGAIPEPDGAAIGMPASGEAVVIRLSVGDWAAAGPAERPNVDIIRSSRRGLRSIGVLLSLCDDP